MTKNSENFIAQAIITAAGKSSRMGSPKALLDFGGQTFIEHIVSTYSALNIYCLVVTNPLLADRLQPLVENKGGHLAAAANPDWQMIDSLRYGLKQLPLTTVPLFIQPVDMPFVSHDLLSALLNKIIGQAIVIPTTTNGPGHPLLLNNNQYQWLTSSSCDNGIKAALQNANVTYLSWNNKKISCNINSPQDYQNYCNSPQKVVFNCENLHNTSLQARTFT